MVDDSLDECELPPCPWHGTVGFYSFDAQLQCSSAQICIEWDSSPYNKGPQVSLASPTAACTSRSRPPTRDVTRALPAAAATPVCHYIGNARHGVTPVTLQLGSREGLRAYQGHGMLQRPCLSLQHLRSRLCGRPRNFCTSYYYVCTAVWYSHLLPHVPFSL